jgi:uncharacterized membrane protein YdjX (TVP38/TMEM64 family)
MSYRPPGDWRPPTRPWVFVLVWIGLVSGCLAAFYLVGRLAWWIAQLIA